MTKRVCLEPGCPTLVSGTRCSTHARERDRARGTRQQRGYDADYVRQLGTPEFVQATRCAQCGEPFTLDNPKTGGHTVALRHDGRGSAVEPQCRRCNYGWRATGL